MVQNEVSLSVKGHSYPIQFPTVGQFYQIEAMKQNLSRGFYNSMVLSPSPSAQHALDMIDVEATLVVLAPKFIEDLKVKNFSELDVRDYKLIRDEYFKTVAPFFKEISDLLKGKDESDDVKKEE